MQSAGAPARLDPPPGIAQSWLVRVTDPPALGAPPWDWLTPDERARAARFHFEADQLRSGVTRGVLRGLVGAALGMHPADVRFVEGAFGKPLLDPVHASHDLHFNVSHSGDYAVLALVRSARIGVDIEFMRPARDLTHLARRVFHPDEVRLLEGSTEAEMLERFYRIWARKEAAAKALGRGIGTDFRSFSAWWGDARSGTSLLREIDRDIVSPWEVADLDVMEGYASAIALDQPGLGIESSPLDPVLLGALHG